MTKSRLASFLDACLISGSALIILIITFTKLKLPLLLKLIISTILASVIFILYIKREKKRYKNQQLKLKDKNTFSLIMLKLELMTTKEKQTYFSTLFKKLKSTLTDSNQNISYNKQSFLMTSRENNSKLTQSIIDDTKDKDFDNYYVFCIKQDINLETVQKYKQIEKKNISLIFPEDLYSLIKKVNYSPDISTLEKKKTTIKENLKTILSNLMYKKNAKSFFISGLLIIFSSLFTPFKTYYYTISLILFSVAITCILWGKQ